VSITKRRQRLLTAEFVTRWAATYDRHAGYDQDEELEIKNQLAQLKPKHLTKALFLRLGRWKTARQSRNYESNSESLVKEATLLASKANDDALKLHVLTSLRGVDIAVASTISHFLDPDSFPIFDVRVRRSLTRAGEWARRADDSSKNAWLEYVAATRRLCKRLSVSQRKLDKALWAYDKYKEGVF